MFKGHFFISLLLLPCLTTTMFHTNAGHMNLFAGTVNWALNQPAYDSSHEMESRTASEAFDGNMETRWSSNYSDPQWMYVDLGATYSINQVIIYWEGAYATAYQIQVSDDASSWTDVFSTTSGDGGTDDVTFAATDTRYVRVYGTTRATSYGYSIWELEVYADESLPVEMSTMEAVNVPEGIKICWITESEVNVQGFHIWRSEKENEDYVLITNDIIPGKGYGSSRAQYSFVDINVIPDIGYYYQIEQIDLDGSREMFHPIQVVPSVVPDQFELSQNYPNPFNPETKINYQISSRADVKLIIYNAKGQIVKSLVDGAQAPGFYHVTWNGRNQSGNLESSGIYIYRLDVSYKDGYYTDIKKMMFLK